MLLSKNNSLDCKVLGLDKESGLDSHSLFLYKFIMLCVNYFYLSVKEKILWQKGTIVTPGNGVLLPVHVHPV